MDLLISEVQITCIILMGLFSLFLAFAISRYTVVGKEYDHARKILTCGTSLVTIHFIVQYLLHKNAPMEEVNLRTIVNLSFGIPLSYLFYMSNYYILRKGKIALLKWLLAPIFLFISSIILVVCSMYDHIEVGIKIMGLMYAYILVYYGFIQLKEYRRVAQLIHSGVDISLLPYIKWIRCSLFIMVFISLGFPIMTFCTNLLMRSLYGIMSISVGFFYVLSFMGYGINGRDTSNHVDQKPKETKMSGYLGQRVANDSEERLEQMKLVIAEFVSKESFIRNGITQKEAADEMGVSVYRLKQWLNNSEFETFSRWIIYLRLVKSKKMMKEFPNLTNDEVADRCGFCDRQYFQRSFKKWMGVTPSQWIKEEDSSAENKKYAQ